MTGPRLVTVAELAECLAVPPRTIYRLAAEGLPGSYRIRRSWRFRLEEVLEALRQPSMPDERGVNRRAAGP